VHFPALPLLSSPHRDPQCCTIPPQPIPRRHVHEFPRLLFWGRSRSPRPCWKFHALGISAVFPLLSCCPWKFHGLRVSDASLLIQFIHAPTAVLVWIRARRTVRGHEWRTGDAAILPAPNHDALLHGISTCILISRMLTVSVSLVATSFIDIPTTIMIIITITITSLDATVPGPHFSQLTLQSSSV
jgi:hypothetical protein